MTNYTTLADETIFLFLNGLWSGKKPPFLDVFVLRNTNFTKDGILDFSNVAIIPVEKKKLLTRTLNPGDILIERSGGGPAQPVGRVCIFEIKKDVYSFSNFLSCLRIINPEKLFPKYVLYSLLNFYNTGGTESLQKRTTGIRNLDFTDYKKQQIPLHPLPEQKIIATVLTKIQKAIEIQDKILVSLRDLKKSMMYHFFSYGLREKGRKKTEIGWIPGGWEVVNIGSFGNIFTGTTPPTANRDYYNDGVYQFITPADIGKKTQIYETGKKISESGLSVSRVLSKYSVCFVCIGSTIGKVGITCVEKATTNQQINTIVTNKYNPFYLTYLLDFNSHYIASFATPSPVPIISKGKFSDIIIAVSTDKQEQDEIARILQTIDHKIEIHEGKNASYQDLFKTMLNKLMTGTIRVSELDIDTSEVEAA